MTTIETDALRLSMELAKMAVGRGDHPFGCCIVRRIKTPNAPDALDIVVRCANTVHTQNDPTGHAELNAIRELGKFVAETKAKQPQATADAPKATVSYELFTSTEPCIMCCGAIYWSFLIDRVVYACSEKALAVHAGDDFLASASETLAKGRRPIAVEGPVFEEEAGAIHASFWAGYLAKLTS